MTQDPADTSGPIAGASLQIAGDRRTELDILNNLWGTRASIHLLFSFSS